MHIHPYITTLSPCTTRLPNNTPHSALASRSFSDQSSPRTLSPRRVHRPSSTPTAHQHHRWQVLPPLRTSPISSWQPIPRSEPAATYLCVCTASLLHQHRRMSLEAREVQRRQRVRANCGHCGRECDEGARDPGGHSSLRLPGGDSACRACRDDDANQLGIRQHRLASQRRRGQRVR